MTLEKRVQHLAVRFYRAAGVELVLVPLIEEVAGFTRSAGDGYFMVSLVGEPGTAYPVNLRIASTLEPDYLGKKFRLDHRGYGYAPEELSAALREVAQDIAHEEEMDR